MDVYRMPNGDIRILTEDAAASADAEVVSDVEAGVFFRGTLNKQAGKQQPITPARAAKGFAGLASEAMGRGVVDHSVAAERWATCLGCDRFDLGKCSAKGCGCHLSAKVRLAKESCPLGKWEQRRG